VSDPASASPQPTEPRNPKLMPRILTTVGGALPALISCGGFLRSMEDNTAANAFPSSSAPISDVLAGQHEAP